MDVTLVPCSPTDKDFVFAVTGAAMRPYVEQAFGPAEAELLLSQEDGRVHAHGLGRRRPSAGERSEGHSDEHDRPSQGIGGRHPVEKYLQRSY